MQSILDGTPKGIGPTPPIGGGMPTGGIPGMPGGMPGTPIGPGGKPSGGPPILGGPAMGPPLLAPSDARRTVSFLSPTSMPLRPSHAPSTTLRSSKVMKAYPFDCCVSGFLIRSMVASLPKGSTSDVTCSSVR